MRHNSIKGKSHCNSPGKGHRVVTVYVLLIVFLLAGCATTPIGTREVSVRRNYEEINVNALKKNTYSDASKAVLQRYFLIEAFKKDPDRAIGVLHEKACEDDRRDLLYALSELTYLTAYRIQRASETTNSERAKRYYLASAIYAYFYLLGERGGEPPSPYDRRFRVACDLYNTALAQALLAAEGGALAFADGMRKLPVGSIVLELQRSQFPHALERFERFIHADQLMVYGLTVRDRNPGLGAPFIAVDRKRSADEPVALVVPGTVFLRIQGEISDVTTGTCRGQLEVYSCYERNDVQVGDKHVPLEDDLTVPLAYGLNEPLYWKFGLTEFLKGRELIPSGVYPEQPYSPGKVPVVFVHGTTSTPASWSEMFNTLRADQTIRQKFQFWYYLYDSGKPIPFSAVHFRESLTQIVKELDPDEKDQALRRMIIIGHSQGGLLTKLTAVDTGDAIIRAVYPKKLEGLDLSEEEREAIRRYLIYKPLPFVTRVVFVSTPHRGSYVVKNWIITAAKKVISLPKKVLTLDVAYFSVVDRLLGIEEDAEAKRLRTSVDSMSPQNPGLLALAEIPLAPGIQGHSIIAIKGDEEPPEGEDGLVTYRSAHVDYVESEFIVRSEHSCQTHPLAIEEVRRILLEHVAEAGVSSRRTAPGEK